MSTDYRMYIKDTTPEKNRIFVSSVLEHNLSNIQLGGELKSLADRINAFPLIKKELEERGIVFEKSPIDNGHKYDYCIKIPYESVKCTGVGCIKYLISRTGYKILDKET